MNDIDIRLLKYCDWLQQTLADYPGAIVSSRSWTVYGMRIRRLLGSWSNHTALSNGDPADLMIADAEHPVARWTPWGEYRERIMCGHCLLRICLPPLYSEAEGASAVRWWTDTVCGRRYDWRAIIWLWLQVRIRAWGFRHWEWAWYCTEGVAAAWDVTRARIGSTGQPRQVFGKPPERCTPGTVDKRAYLYELEELYPPWCVSYRDWVAWLAVLERDMQACK